MNRTGWLESAVSPGPEGSFGSVDDFWAAHTARNGSVASPVERAILGGALADRVGYAFVAGYSAALQALFPDLPATTQASLAATEDGGAHPKAIRTSLSGEDGALRLTGKKAWVTLGGAELFVLARRGELVDGRANLVVVRVERSAPGVTLEPFPATPFVPEVPHAAVTFEATPIAEDRVLDGDGWDRWVKPFRTVEDVHVHAAVLAYLSATGARLNWEPPLREKLASLLVTFRALAAMPPSEETTHLALAGAISEAAARVADCEAAWARTPSEAGERWARDRALLKIASKARAARTQKAWERSSTPGR